MRPRLEQLEARLAPATLDLGGYATPVNVTLAFSDATGFSGTLSGGASGTFSGVDAILGNGGALRGRNVNSAWALDAGSLASSYFDGVALLHFDTFAAVRGGASNDTFAVKDDAMPASLTGISGTDTLDFSDASNGAATFAIGATGINNAGTVAGGTFSAVANLVGSQGDDVFAFSPGRALTGRIDGAGGTNTLDYSAYLTSVRVSLAGGVATAVGHGIAGIANVTSGGANDVLIGDAGTNALSGNAGNDALVGMGGDDTLSGGAGRDILIGGDGADTLDGGSGENIIIGGNYANQTNVAALAALMSEWARTDLDFASRVDHLNGTTPFGLNGIWTLTPSTVLDDGAADTLSGDGTLPNWYWIESVGGVADVLTNPMALDRIDRSGA